MEQYGSRVASGNYSGILIYLNLHGDTFFNSRHGQRLMAKIVKVFKNYGVHISEDVRNRYERTRHVLIVPAGPHPLRFINVPRYLEGYCTSLLSETRTGESQHRNLYKSYFWGDLWSLTTEYNICSDTTEYWQNGETICKLWGFVPPPECVVRSSNLEFE